MARSRQGRQRQQLEPLRIVTTIRPTCLVPFDRWRELEQAAGRARVPILGLTANVMSGDRDKCLAAGMDDVLPKPITLEALSQAIEKAMAL